MPLLTADELREVRQLHGRLIQAHPAWSVEDQLALVGALAMALSHADALVELLRWARGHLNDAGRKVFTTDAIDVAIATHDAAKGRKRFVEGDPHNPDFS